jgi:hypothetical protein
MPGPKAAYVGFMDHERNLPQSPPQAWIDGLAEGEADVLAGHSQAVYPPGQRRGLAFMLCWHR